MIINAPLYPKLFGCNIAAKQSYGVGTSYGNAWAQLFLSWDWTGWIKPQIDAVVGNGIGCNCISLIGSLEGVFAGTFSQATYSANWQQLVDYCAGLGVYVYFRAGWYPQVSAASASYLQGAGHAMTDQQIADGINNTLADLTTRTNIIGVDLMQENNGWGPVGGESLPATRSISIYNKVKAGGTALPCTFSTYDVWTNAGSTSPESSASGRGWITDIASALDYLDFHFYAMSGYDASNPIAASDVNYWRTTYPTLDIMYGEFGSPENAASYDVIASFYKSVLTAASSGDVKNRGACCWAATDGNNVTSDEWGLMDVTFATPRLARTRAMRQFAGGSVARRN